MAPSLDLPFAADLPCESSISAPARRCCPEPVLRTAAAEMLDWHGSGMCVMEMSHRGKEFIGIADKAEADLRTLLAIPDDYEVLFLQGGAIGENAIVPMNLFGGHTRRRLRPHRRMVEEVDQGGEEVRQGERGRVVGGARASPAFPSAPRGSSRRAPPTCTSAATRRSAASSTTGRRTSATCRWSPTCRRTSCRAPLDVARYGVIYGGAQKNIGPAGLTIVIVRDDLLDRALPITPSAFHWKEQAEADSMLNTPPTYAIYVAGLVFEWLLAQGGLPAIEQKNIAKAALLYDYLDQSRFYTSPVRKQDRSRMNVPFKLPRRRARRAVPQGREGAGHGAAQGAPLGRRHARVDLQRDADRGRAGARRLDAEFERAHG